LLVSSNSDNQEVHFNNCVFEKNKADVKGGVVYVHKLYSEDNVPQYNRFYFNDCKFINNTADLGNSLYI